MNNNLTDRVGAYVEHAEAHRATRGGHAPHQAQQPAPRSLDTLKAPGMQDLVDLMRSGYLDVRDAGLDARDKPCGEVDRRLGMLVECGGYEIPHVQELDGIEPGRYGADGERHASWLGDRDSDRPGGAAGGMSHVEKAAPLVKIVALEQIDRCGEIAHATVNGSPFGEIQGCIRSDRRGQFVDPRFKMASRDRRARWLELLVHQGPQAPQVHLAGARIVDDKVNHQVGNAATSVLCSPLERVGAVALRREILGHRSTSPRNKTPERCLRAQFFVDGVTERRPPEDRC